MIILLPFFLLLLQRMAHSIPLPLSKLNSHLAPFENGCLVTFEVIPDSFVANALSKLKLTKTASVSSLNECAFVCYQNFCSAAIFEFAQPISRCHLQIGPGEICNRRLQRHYSFRNQQRAIISCIRCSPSKPVTISREAELPLGASTLAPPFLPIFRPLSPRPSLPISPSSSPAPASPPASNPLTASPQNATSLANAGEGEKDELKAKKEKNIEKGKKKEGLERKEEGKKKKTKEEGGKKELEKEEEEIGKKEGKEKEIKEEMKEEGRKSDEKQGEKEEEEQFAKRNLQKLTADLLKQEGEKWRISTGKNGTEEEEEENGEKKKKKIEGKLAEEEKPKKLFNTVFSLDLLAEEHSKKGWKIGAKAKKEEAQNGTKNELGETTTKEMGEEEELRRRKDGKKDEEERGRTEEPIEVVTFEEAEKGTETTTMGRMEGKNSKEGKKEEEGKEKEENLEKRNLKVISLDIGKEGELTTTPEGIEKMETTLGGEKRKEEGENSAEIIAKIEKKIKTKDLAKKEEKSKEIFSMAFDGKEEEINRKKKHREEGEGRKIEGGGELEGKKEDEKEATPCDEKKEEKKENKKEGEVEEEEQLAKRNLKAQTLDELKGNAEKLRESKLNKKEDEEEKGHLKGKIEEEKGGKENGQGEENTSEVKKNEGKDEVENGEDKKVEKKEGEGKGEEKGERKEEENRGKKEEERKEGERKEEEKKEEERKEEKSDKKESEKMDLEKKEEEVASTIATELPTNQTVQTSIILESTKADDSESTLRESTTSSSVGLEELSTERTTKEEEMEERTTSRGKEENSTENGEKSTEKPHQKEKEDLHDEEDGKGKKKGGEGEEDGIEKKSEKEGKKKRNEKSLDSKELKDKEEEWAKEHGFMSDEGREEVPKSDEKKEDEKKGGERKKGKGGIGLEGSEGEREETESGEEKIRPRRSRANAAKTLNGTAVPLVERSIDSLAPAKGNEPPETHPSPPTIRLENGCFITFQAESLANRPTQFKAPFELSLEVESIEICAVRCYQDGCTGALYHSHNKTCILGYEDKHFCSAGPIISRFRHLAQLKGVNPIWIHCVNCRPEVNRLTGDLERIEGSKRGQRPIQAQPTSTHPPAPQSPLSTPILPIVKSSTSISAINRQQPISSESVSPSTAQIPALSTTTLAKIILPSSTPTPPLSISLTHSPVSTKASNDLPKNVDPSTPRSTPSPSISPITSTSTNAPIHSASPSSPIVPPSVAPIELRSGSNIPGTIKLDHGCFITFQAEPLAKRPSNHKAPFELKLDVESIEVCAIRCYQDGCTGALFHSKSRICELSYDDKHFCSNAPIISKFAHLAELRAVDPLWIHCVNCRPEVNRKTGQLENKKRE